jgi:hypothetical protein
VIEVWVPAAATSTTQIVNYGADVGARSAMERGRWQNPFAVKSLAAGALQVSYTVPATAGLTQHRVKVVLTSLQGEHVRTLVDRLCDARYHSETVGAASGVGAGVYLCKLTIDNIPAAITTITLAK